MSERVQARRRQLAYRLTWTALTWSIGLLLTALLAPAFNDQTTSDASGLTLHSATFVEVNGAWVLIPIALPALASLIVAFAISRREEPAAPWAWLPVAVVGAVGLITIPSVGILLLPVAILLTLALRLVPLGANRPAPRSSQSGGSR